MAHSPKEILEEIISGMKVDMEETERSQPVDAFTRSNSCGQVPKEVNHTEPVNVDAVKIQLDMKVQDQQASVPSVLEEVPPNKSRLSPLAARAALASRVSTAYDDVINGTKLDDPQVIVNLSVVGVSPSDPSTLVPVIAETVNVVNRSILDENGGSLKPQLEESLEVTNSSARSKPSTKERKSPESAKPGRVTRSSMRKSTSFVTSEEKMQMDDKDITRNNSANTEGSSLPSGFKEIADTTGKGSAGNTDLNRITKSVDSTRSKLKKSTVAQKKEQEELSEMEAEMCTPAEEVADETSTFAENNQPSEGQSAKRKLIEPSVPSRVTRSAVKKAAGDASNDFQMKSCDEEDQGRASKKTRRSSRSTELKKTETFTVSQGLDDDNTKSGHTEMNAPEEESTPARKKEPVSLQMDSEGQTPTTKKDKAKTSTSSKKAQKTKGKLTGLRSHGQSEKSASTSKQSEKSASTSKQNNKSASTTQQERRFSHRLAFLPRTRSQVKH
ncbi:hypothetical protein CDL15_Pgr001892 [Punica granatum]|uniref:Uncharacterized protein n=2 Tax=Punica granatum TaxID=22663 RepID=A0A218XC05_PUNGR|nr:hypothetical protein CDL15_Pgr001892 [Punica granatum]